METSTPVPIRPRGPHRRTDAVGPDPSNPFSTEAPAVREVVRGRATSLLTARCSQEIKLINTGRSIRLHTALAHAT